jgi:hypothetical protein
MAGESCPAFMRSCKKELVDAGLHRRLPGQFYCVGKFVHEEGAEHARFSIDPHALNYSMSQEKRWAGRAFLHSCR